MEPELDNPGVRAAQHAARPDGALLARGARKKPSLGSSRLGFLTRRLLRLRLAVGAIGVPLGATPVELAVAELAGLSVHDHLVVRTDRRLLGDPRLDSGIFDQGRGRADHLLGHGLWLRWRV